MPIGATVTAGIPRAAQARIRLQGLDDAHEVVEADDPLELEARAFVAHPDHVGFDAADLGQANDHPVAALDTIGVVDHEAVRRQVGDVQLEVAALVMLGDHREVDRVPRRTTQIGYRQLSSDSHDPWALRIAWTSRVRGQRLILR